MPRPGGNRERSETPKGGVAWDLIAYTGLTGVDVFVDELSHPRPMIISRQQFQSLLLSQMPGGFGVVVLRKDLYLYLIDSRNIHPSIVQDHPLCIGGERLEVQRIFVASRQGGVSYLRKIGTDFGVLIEGSEDILGTSVLRRGRSSVDSIQEEVGGEDRVFRIDERGIYLFWLQKGHMSRRAEQNYGLRPES